MPRRKAKAATQSEPPADVLNPMRTQQQLRQRTARARRPFIYRTDTPDVEAEVADTDAARQAFAVKLDGEMRQREWSNAHVARLLGVHPSLVGQYRLGRYLPSPARLDALAELLGLHPLELAPVHCLDAAQQAAKGIEVAPLSDGRLRLRISATVTREEAATVLQALGVDEGVLPPGPGEDPPP
jgi:transcriptional regulator with XRE-family HTH domain